MARIRSVHPGLFTDADWVECSPMARLLIIGLWTHADDQGTFVWRSKEIKMTIMPGDDVAVDALLDELCANNLIRHYEVDGRKYGAVRNFRRWQRPQKPNVINPLPECLRNYVGIDMPESPTDPEPVRDHYDTATVIAKQKEEVGSRSIGKGVKTPAKAGEPDGFAAAFDAYPHVKQRKSRPEALRAFAKLPPAEQITLAQAAQDFAVSIKPKDSDFVPAMEVWLNKGLHRNYGQAPPGDNLAACIQAYRTSGVWHHEWGEKPADLKLTA